MIKKGEALRIEHLSLSLSLRCQHLQI